VGYLELLARGGGNVIYICKVEAQEGFCSRTVASSERKLKTYKILCRSRAVLAHSPNILSNVFPPALVTRGIGTASVSEFLNLSRTLPANFHTGNENCATKSCSCPREFTNVRWIEESS
jgi:hypothetical protein